MATSNGHAIYELSGRALLAARQLEEEVKQQLKIDSVLRSGNMQKIKESWDDMYRALLTRLSKNARELLNDTGITSPAIRVYKGVQSLPRAYREYPQIFLSPEENPRYFMYAPLDYKGAHFVPADSRRVPEEEEAIIGDLLFAGGWLGNAPIVSITRRGVETPADYVAPSEETLRKEAAYSPNDRVVFLAAGQSLDLVKDYRARVENWKEKLNIGCQAVTAEAEKMKAAMLRTLPEGEDITINTSYSYSTAGGQAELLLSARRAGKLNIFDGGKLVDIPPSPAYDLVEKHAGSYKVTPRSDTPEGRKLAAILNDIPLTPSLGDYPALCANYKIKQTPIGQMLGVDGVMPQALEIEGHTVLLYNCAPGSDGNKFCPPGAKPLAIEVFEWLRSDQGDLNMGMTPPPRPQAVIDALKEIRKPRPPKPAPKR